MTTTIAVENSRDVGCFFHAIELRSVEAIALPPNRGMQLTSQSVTGLAGRRARPAPLWLAADA
jgi:hypothetical protein